MLLKNGSNGDDVKKLQEKLGLTADGIFGNVTEFVLRKWQLSNGLESNGIVDDNVWKKLFEYNNINSKIKLEKLKGYIPENVLSQIPDIILKFNCNNILRLSHFLSQCSHESGNFKAVSENLNYSSDGLKKIFPKYFPDNLSKLYAKKPDKIASRVYADRMGNGDELSMDGWKFRGRGYIQLTGKDNYIKFSKFIGEDCLINPDLVSSKYPLSSAAFFFDSNNIWSICDRGYDNSTITLVSKKVNGGVIGLNDRIKNFKEIYNLLTK